MNVCYFEIPVADLERAMRFYSAVFQIELEPANVDGHPMAYFPVTDAANRITGALAQGDSYEPHHGGPRVYFKTEDIEATLARAVEAGGRVLYPVKSIGELGWVAEFEDSEGNCIALHAD
jgi:predicted enzyme related to lactoylglutathione lyase